MTVKMLILNKKHTLQVIKNKNEEKIIATRFFAETFLIDKIALILVCSDTAGYYLKIPFTKVLFLLNNSIVIKNPDESNVGIKMFQVQNLLLQVSLTTVESNRGWLDIFANIDLWVATYYSVTSEIIHFSGI